VALSAIKLRPLERQFFDFVFIENVEDRPLIRIEQYDLDRLPVPDPSDIDIVVEVERARRLRRNFPELKTSPGENQRLRTDRDVEQFEHRFKIAAPGFISQLRLATVEPSLKPGHRVVDWRGAIIDRLFAERHVALITHRDLPTRRKVETDETQRHDHHEEFQQEQWKLPLNANR
jgi:hypothetical protein